MPVDTSIYGNMLRPVKSIAEYDAEYQAAEQNKLARLLSGQQLQVGQMKMDEYTRGVEKQNKLQALLGGLPANATMDQRVNALRGGGYWQEADAAQKGALEAEKSRAAIGKDTAETEAKYAAMVKDLAGVVFANPTRATVQAVMAQARAQTGKPLTEAQAMFDAAGDDPEALRRIAAGLSMKAEQLLPKTDITNMGNAQSFGATNPLTGVRTETGSAPTEAQTPFGYSKASSGAISVDPGFLQSKQSIAAAGAPRVSVNTTNETAYAKAAGSKSAEHDLGAFEVAQTAADSVDKLAGVLNHLETSDAITGIGQEVFTNIERLKSQFLNDKKAGKKVTDTQYLDALLGSDVFPMIKALGVGARGMDTPAEREFLRQVMTGTLALDRDTLIKMTKVRLDINRRLVERFNKRVDDGSMDRFFTNYGVPKQKLDVPMVAGSGAGGSSSAVDEALKKYGGK